MTYPRVTEILKPFTSWHLVPKDVLEKAAARGTSVHAICAALADDEWVPDGMINQELLGYVNSFKKWKEAQVAKFLIIEKRYKDDDLLYSGQLDFVIEGTDGKLYLVDLKTSASPQKSYSVQMGAYDLLLRKHEILVEAAMIVYLDKSGEFPEIELLEDMTRERQVFLSALNCYEYFNKRKKNDTR